MVRELAYEPYYLWQQDYVDGSAEMYEVDGVTIYVPTDRGQIGYNKFPSSPIVQDIELRGNSIRDGFRKKPKRICKNAWNGLTEAQHFRKEIQHENLWRNYGRRGRNPFLAAEYKG